MRTPAGTECRYFYQDYYRGRFKQECRLISHKPFAESWQPRLCSKCTIPAILRANGCPNLILEARVVRRWFGLQTRVEVTAFCTETREEVANPYVGCGRCHPAAAAVLESPLMKK